MKRLIYLLTLLAIVGSQTQMFATNGDDDDDATLNYQNYSGDSDDDDDND